MTTTPKRKPRARRAALLHLPALIARKRDGGVLTDGEIRDVIAAAASGAIPEYQISALLMAIVWRGLRKRAPTPAAAPA